MDEEHSRSKLYSYEANANLVIRNKGRIRNQDDPSGEAQAMEMDPMKMGDRALAPTNRATRIVRNRIQRKGEESLNLTDGAKYKPKVNREIPLALDQFVGTYHPTTRESRIVFERLLSLVQRVVGDQPRSVLQSATDELLAIVKDPETTAPTKLTESQKLIGKGLDEQTFMDILKECDLISDFLPASERNGANQQQGNEINGNGADSGVFGVAVQFDDESGNENSDGETSLVEYVDTSDSDDDGKAEVGDVKESVDEDHHGDRSNKQILGSLKGDQIVECHEIDAFWVQRALDAHYSDANESQEISRKVLEILGESEDRVCENKLFLLLGFDKFQLIKVLLLNKERLWYCVRLKQASNEEAVQKIYSEMAADKRRGGGEEILRLLESGELSKSADSKRISGRVSGKVRIVDADTPMSNLSNNVEEPFASQMETKRVPEMLNLQDLILSAGEHTMSNKKVRLAKNAWRKRHKYHEEVHVPPPRPKPFGTDEKLISIKSLPIWSQHAFSKMDSLNRIQSRAFSVAFKEDFNMLLCAPTGAGKTNVALLTILHEIGKYVDGDSVDIKRMKNNMKIVYVAPMKALVQEVVQNLGKRLKFYDVQVRELSGDQQLSREEILATQIIVTTPEKWDIISRKAHERAYTQLVKLLIVDEIHLLHNDRGAVIEALIARSIRLQELTQQRIRIVAISATLPNYVDVATFCRVPLDKGLFFFDNSYRPVPLQQQYIGLIENKPIKRFHRSNEICYEKVTGVLRRNSKDQILIFVHSRKEAVASAKVLKQTSEEKGETKLFINEDKPESTEVLQSEAEEKVQFLDLKELLPSGIGVHHAGMPRGDRTLVEELFRSGYLKILVCTATLAWGVNLPAHTVVIKGTQVYSPEKGRWTELSQLDILQMLGRAGRPQYDTEGEGIIITTSGELQYYLSLLNEQLPIESQLVRRIADSLNSELASNTIQSLDEAAHWIGYTYLYVRMLRSPATYGISPDVLVDDPTLEQRRLDLAHSALSLLSKGKLCVYDRRSGHVQSLPLGKVSAYYYVGYETIIRFNNVLRGTMTDIDLFRIVTLASEFQDITVRDEEKPELAKLADRVPIPVKEDIEEPSAKVNILLQSYISGLQLSGYALACDLVFIHQSAGRIIRALFEMCLIRNWGALASRCLDVANMCDRRIWKSQCFLRQLSSTALSSPVLRKLERHHLTVDQVFALSPHQIGELCSVGIKQGRIVHRAVHCFPKVDLSATVRPITRSTLRVDLVVAPDFEFDSSLYDGSTALLFWVFVEDGDCDELLHWEQFVLTRESSQREHEATFTVSLPEVLPPVYYIKVLSDRYLNSVTTLPLSFSKLILPGRFLPPTELLDLRPLRTDGRESAAWAENSEIDIDFVNKAFSRLFVSKFDEFNAIQSQCFSCITSTDENFFIGGPCGSGKTAIFEMAIIRALGKDLDAKCVYIAPHQATCMRRFAQWRKAFDLGLKMRVVLLSGDTIPDLRSIESASIIISTPEAWDNLSRRWKQRKAVRNISLFLIDDLHFVSGGSRSTMEVIVSRMRFMASTLKDLGNVRIPRIGGIGVSVANASDLAAWIGADKKDSVFNFHPSSRPNRLDIELRGFDENHFGSRMLAMARPCFDILLKNLANSSDRAMVFVPSRRQAKVTAVDIMTFAFAHKGALLSDETAILENSKKLFGRKHGDADSELLKLLDDVEDPTLKRSFEYGVGFLYQGMSPKDRALVEAAYASSSISILIVVADDVWGLDFYADLVVVMGTSRYDASAHDYVEYPVTDLLQMIGRSNRFGSSRASRCTVLCQTKRKAFLRKFLNEPLPVESHLHLDLADPLCVEVVSGVVSNKQDAVDYLTWSFLFRRIAQNPSYYNIAGQDSNSISDFLSEVVEEALEELVESKCIAVDDNEMDVSPLNFGMVASHYSIQHSTVKLFSMNLSSGSRLRRIFDVMVSADEFESVGVRQNERSVLASLANQLPIPQTDPDFAEPRTKSHILLQLHFLRRKLSTEQREDLNIILQGSLKLLQAIVDIIASNAWLQPALAAMELSQMIVQGRWNTDSPLLQIPFFDQATVERCHAAGVKRVYEIADLDEDKLNDVLQLQQDQLVAAAEFCNRYPDIAVSVVVVDPENVRAGETVRVEVTLERLDEDEEEPIANQEPKRYGEVVAPFFPVAKVEAYWLVIGSSDANSLYSIKKTPVGKFAKLALEFDAPKTIGKNVMSLYLKCDSYLGVDQLHRFDLDVQEGGSDSSSESESSAEDD